jgi:hypothetical protein
LVTESNLLQTEEDFKNPFDDAEDDQSLFERDPNFKMDEEDQDENLLQSLDDPIKE